MTKIWKWLVDHKGWLKYWYVPFLIIGAVFIYKDCSSNDGEIIQALKNGIKYRNNIIEGAENNVATLKIERDVLKDERDKAQRSFKKKKEEFDNASKIKPPTKIKTVTIEKIVYVEKTEYDNLWKFTKETLDKLSVYFRLDRQADFNIDKIVDGYEKIISDLKLNISDYEKLLKLKKKQKRIGLYFGFGITQNKNFAINLSIGYRIF